MLQAIKIVIYTDNTGESKTFSQYFRIKYICIKDLRKKVYVKRFTYNVFKRNPAGLYSKQAGTQDQKRGGFK